jgi:hypothetical protein
MGKTIGAAFIIYGFLNLIGGIVLLFMIRILGFAGIVWSLIFIGLGLWMSGNAKRHELPKRIAKTSNVLQKYIRGTYHEYNSVNHHL